jgi:hypothetical protein
MDGFWRVGLLPLERRRAAQCAWAAAAGAVGGFLAHRHASNTFDGKWDSAGCRRGQFSLTLGGFWTGRASGPFMHFMLPHLLDVLPSCAFFFYNSFFEGSLY